MKWLTWFALMLTAWLASACAAQPATKKAPVVPTIEVSPINRVQETETAEPAKVPSPEPEAPPLPDLSNWEAVADVGPCYDFLILSGALKGLPDEVRLVFHKPCLIVAFQMWNTAQPASQFTLTSNTLQPADAERYFPTPCVETTLLGGTISPPMSCFQLRHQFGTDKYSLVGLDRWYRLLREATKNAEQNSP